MTRSVLAGGVKIGGGAPVTIQSMTNSDTRDARATLNQCLALEAAGCEIIRISVYDEACIPSIRLLREGLHTPLVADIHFDHRLAILAMEAGIDKLRINPGNIGGKAHVSRLADCARQHGVPIRVGVNGGSLEKDLLEKYGRPCPEAMVESGLRHIAMLERAGFYDTVISLKASNVPDTVGAYRLMRQRVDYPLHIGITEAGVREDAIIKSAAGLGSLLIDGIGDTIRVSITGDPVEEVHTARGILTAVGLRSEGVEVVSCPTCGRCNVELARMARLARNSLPRTGCPLKVAVMGCAVNGPGEAREADIGIAFGKGNGVLFKKGERFASGDAEEMFSLLLSEAHALSSPRQA